MRKIRHHVCVSAMKKRKRYEEAEGRDDEREADEATRVERKKTKVEADPLEKLLSLVESGDSAAGVCVCTY